MSHGVSPARLVAIDSFVRTMDASHNMSAEVALEEAYRTSGGLSRLDRNFAKEILYGSLRWYAKILWILQKISSRDLNSSPPQVRAALIVGTYQIYYMDRVPDRAAVNESVEYVRHKGLAHACTFVNGILRQVARRSEYFAKPDKQQYPAEYLSLQFSHPEWMVRRWLDRFKFEKMELMLASHNAVPTTSGRVNTMKVPLKEIGEFQKELLRKEKTHSDRRPLRSAIRFNDFPQLDPGSLFGQGYFTIQDESSQLIGLLVAPKEGELILDACCGLGGKLTHLNELAQGQARLIGVDKAAGRLTKAKAAAERLGHQGLEFVEADFLEYETTERADAILLDVPCSGLGVLRRHPEGKWHKKPELIRTMAGIQRSLLKKAVEVVKPGGRIIYSACTFELEETTDQKKWLLQTFPHLESVSPLAYLPDYYKKYVTRDDVMLIYSGNGDDIDGFGAFVVRAKS